MPFKILCDENLSGAVTASLDKWGFNVMRVKPGTNDKEIGKQLKAEKAILLTFDSDFANILEYPPSEFFGIIRIKIDPALNDTVLAALDNFFRELKNESQIKGRLIIITPSEPRTWEA